MFSRVIGIEIVLFAPIRQSLDREGIFLRVSDELVYWYDFPEDEPVIVVTPTRRVQ